MAPALAPGPMVAALLSALFYFGPYFGSYFYGPYFYGPYSRHYLSGPIAVWVWAGLGWVVGLVAVLLVAEAVDQGLVG